MCKKSGYLEIAAAKGKGMTGSVKIEGHAQMPPVIRLVMVHNIRSTESDI